MPVLYRGIVDEHRHTREACSAFDVSHMGRLRFDGADAERLLERVCTRRLGDMEPGQSRYSHVCNEAGGVLDDVIVSRLERGWFVVCNASNRTRIVAWLREHSAGLAVTLEDETESTAMVAIQGPRTLAHARRVLPFPLDGLRRYHFVEGAYLGQAYRVFRSGYTGEDGLEVVLPAAVAAMGWQFLLAPADEFEPAVVKPAGLGARDTLRIEAGLPLYGHELHENTDPLHAGLGWCVDLTKDFIGAEALRAVAAGGVSPRLVGLELSSRRIARQGCAVHVDGRTVGEVTSGTWAPTLERSIAMAYVESGAASPGTAACVRIRDSEEDAVVVSLPFYKRPAATGT